MKVGIKIAKRTVQRYMRRARPQRSPEQMWSMFLYNHAKDIWACDFLQVSDMFFRPLFAFVNTELTSRRIVHVGVTRSPTDAWVALQLREAMPFGIAPKHLVRDNDAKFGACFNTVAVGSGIEVIRTPMQAHRANAICALAGRRAPRVPRSPLGRERSPPPSGPQGVRGVLQPIAPASRH